MRTKVAPAHTRSTPTGTVTAIVAVTGVVDEVGDIIQPGIFGPALAKRWPKCVHNHLLEKFTGRVVAAEEWMPGDPRLPKTHQSGKPWPAAAGALVATMQFNLKTQLGREAYEWAKFYHESDESAWSIGYKVPPGTSVRRGGIRIIRAIDLFEVSIVLHGAHPLTMALEVKSAVSAVAQARTGLEFKTAPDVAPLDDDVAVADAPAAQPDHSGGVMVALYPDEETAGRLAHKGGLPPEELHVTLAYLGDVDGAEFTKDDVVSAVRAAVAGASPFGGQIGGLGMFPPSDDGTPIWAPVDLPALPTLREGIVRALDDGPTAGAVARDHGYTPHMTLGYDLETVDPVPPAPVQFDRATVVWGKERIDVPFGPQPTPPLERKGAAWAVQQARSATPMETKMSQHFPGSHQELNAALNQALRDEFCPQKDKDKDKAPRGWVSIQATYPDHVIATVYEDHDDDGKSYRVPYTFDGDEAKLGKAQEVTLSVVVSPEEAEKPASPTDLVVAPLAAALSDVAHAVTVAPLEVKALDDALRPALVAVFDALDAKGLDVAGIALGEDDDEDDLIASADYPPLDPDAPDVDEPDDLPLSAIEDKDSVPPPSSLHRAVPPAPAAPAPVDPGPEEDPEEDDDVVPVDPEQMRAELDALGV